jgi:hypothetical protein
MVLLYREGMKEAGHSRDVIRTEVKKTNNDRRWDLIRQTQGRQQKNVAADAWDEDFIYEGQYERLTSPELFRNT